MQKSVLKKESFTMADVLEGINEKLIYRHPHVFGDVKVIRSIGG